MQRITVYAIGCVIGLLLIVAGVFVHGSFPKETTTVRTDNTSYLGPATIVNTTYEYPYADTGNLLQRIGATVALCSVIAAAIIEYKTRTRQ